MIFSLATHQGSYGTSESMDQHTALVYSLLVPATVLSYSGPKFLFLCYWYSGEVLEGCLWLQMVVWRRRINQVCYYYFSEIFHVLFHEFCYIFSVRIISVGEKDFHDVNPNLLIVVDLKKVWFPFGFVMLIDWIHHCCHVSIADDMNIPFIFPVSGRNVTKGQKAISTFWSVFPVTCNGFRFWSTRKVPVI